MSTQQLERNPLQEQQRLSEEDQKTAVKNSDLMHSALGVQDDLRFDVKGMLDEDANPDPNKPTRAVNRQLEVLGVNALLRGVARLDVQRVKRKGAKHYKAHEGEYQVQAVKDAAAEQVHTNFGT